MMRFAISPALFLVLQLLAAAAMAQSPAARLADMALPPEADRLEQFVPRGWVVDAQLSGDLNRDKLPDLVLSLMEDRPDADEQGVRNERARALVVLLRTPERRLQLAGVSDRLLLCTLCGGALGGQPDIAIKKGVVVVRQLMGARESTETTQRFRYDPESEQFLLIGEDIRNSDQATGDSTLESINYLTGERITTTYAYDKKRQRQVAVSTEKGRVPKVTRALEETEPW